MMNEQMTAPLATASGIPSILYVLSIASPLKNSQSVKRISEIGRSAAISQMTAFGNFKVGGL
jgi:hypothetical protein